MVLKVTTALVGKGLAQSSFLSYTKSTFLHDVEVGRGRGLAEGRGQARVRGEHRHNDYTRGLKGHKKTKHSLTIKGAGEIA